MSQNKLFQTHTNILDNDDNENVDLINELMNNDDNPEKKMNIEGFIGYDLPPNVNKNQTQYEKQSLETLSNSTLTSKQLTEINDMKKQYNYLVDQYNDTYGKMKTYVDSFVKRIDPSNPYLNSNILIDGHYGNVTNLGSVEWYNSKDDFDKTAGNNGCPASNKIKSVPNVKWATYMTQAGSELPTNPALDVSSVKAVKGQSCGYEGKNVYVSSISNSNNISSFQGCYTDKASSRTMTLLSKEPVTIAECEDLAQRGSYKYFGEQDYKNGKAMCYGSNSIDSIKKYGVANNKFENKVIWSVGDGKAEYAKVAGDGKLNVHDKNGNIIFSNPHGQYVRFYEGSGYTGKETWVPVGSYGYMSKAKLGDNSVRSLKIPKGLSVILYMQANFKALSVTLGPGDYPNLNTLKETSSKFDKATSSLTIFATDGYFLDLANNGNMCLYAGKKDVYTTYQGVWCSDTLNKATGKGNPERAASKGKNGRNYLKQDEKLRKGEWIGSLSGTVYLMLTEDGYLKLINSGNQYESCVSGSDNKKYGVKDESNAVYLTANLGDPSLIGKMGYIDQNSKLSEYPSSMMSKFGSEYIKFPNSGSSYNNIQTITNTNVDNCKTKCNQNDKCGGFVFNKTNSICNLKSTNTFPKDKREFVVGSELYVRRPLVSNDESCAKTIYNIDSNQWKNYAKTGKQMTATTKCTLLNNTYQKQLDSLRDQIDVLANKIQEKNSDFKNRQQNAIKQINKNTSDFENNVKDYNEIVRYNEGQQDYLDGMLDDSRLVMLQQNQKYIMWSVLTVGSIVLAVNLSK